MVTEKITVIAKIGRAKFWVYNTEPMMNLELKKIGGKRKALYDLPIEDMWMFSYYPGSMPYKKVGKLSFFDKKQVSYCEAWVFNYKRWRMWYKTTDEKGLAALIIKLNSIGVNFQAGHLEDSPLNYLRTLFKKNLIDINPSICIFCPPKPEKK